MGEGGKEFGTGSCGAQIKQREKAGSSEFLTLTCQDFARRVKALPTAALETGRDASSFDRSKPFQ